MKSMTDVLRDSVGSVDLRDPLCHLAKHPAVIHLLEGFPFNHVASNLPYEQNHGARILIRRMHADTCIGRTGSSWDEAQTRMAGKFSICFAHERSAALLPAYDQANAIADFVKRVQHVQKAFSWYTKGCVGAMNAELIDQNLSAAPQWRVLVHACSPLLVR